MRNAPFSSRRLGSILHSEFSFSMNILWYRNDLIWIIRWQCISHEIFIVKIHQFNFQKCSISYRANILDGSLFIKVFLVVVKWLPPTFKVIHSEFSMDWLEEILFWEMKSSPWETYKTSLSLRKWKYNFCFNSSIYQCDYSFIMLLFTVIFLQQN